MGSQYIFLMANQCLHNFLNLLLLLLLPLSFLYVGNMDR